MSSSGGYACEIETPNHRFAFELCDPGPEGWGQLVIRKGAELRAAAGACRRTKEEERLAIEMIRSEASMLGLKAEDLSEVESDGLRADLEKGTRVRFRIGSSIFAIRSGREDDELAIFDGYVTDDDGVPVAESWSHIFT